jgi:cyclophilin family peptidyl-prolyl cis-trans isomerase
MKQFSKHRYLFFLSIYMFLLSCSPTASFTIDKNEGVVPAIFAFKNKSKKAQNYLWDFGDGTQTIDANPTHRYFASGNYNISLIASSGKKTSKISQKIQILAPTKCLIELVTSAGTMLIELHNDTPLHRDNFLRLIENGYYSDLLFHRVIKGFMIQAGDPDSRNAPEGRRLGMGGPSYTIAAEINDTLVHIRGALSAARTEDNVNPQKASSGSQFYIVHGKPISNDQLTDISLQRDIKYTPNASRTYNKVGGSPQLDKEYTVFGQVIEGFEIIEKITDAQTDEADRPIDDIKIIKISVIK